MIARDIKGLQNAVPGDGTITDTIYALLKGHIWLDGYVFKEANVTNKKADSYESAYNIYLSRKGNIYEKKMDQATGRGGEVWRKPPDLTRPRNKGEHSYKSGFFHSYKENPGEDPVLRLRRP